MVRNRSRKSDLGKKNPDLGAGSAGLLCRAGGAAGWHPECQASTCQPDMLKQLGSDAGQVARPGGSDAGQVRRNFRQWSPHRTTGFFFTVVGLDDNLNIFFLGRIPTLARASMPGRNVARSVSEPRWASPYSLGEPVLIGRAIKRGWASHSTTFTVANACACLALCLLGTSACSARLLKCLLGTFS